MKQNIIFITGSRNHNKPTYERFNDLVGKELAGLKGSLIITLGGVSGCESYVRKHSATLGIPVLEHRPTVNGEVCTPLSYVTCTQMCDKVIVFWDGNSGREAVSIRYAEELGKPCKVIRL